MLTPDELRPEPRTLEQQADVVDVTDELVYEVASIEVSSPTRDETAAAREFGRWLHSLEYSRVFVVASQHGGTLVGGIEEPISVERPPARANERWVRGLCDRIGRAEAGAVVAVGGGRCLDVAKLAAARCELPFIAVPTQLSHDGICSPVAVVPDSDGMTQSVPASAPFAAYFSLPTIADSPLRSLRAGVGDLISNPFALRDWELAATTGNDVIVDDAWHLSLESYGLIEPHLDRLGADALRAPRFLGLLSHALANSGAAMMLAGSSRPASGGEHKISHAIDIELGGRALHGEQVAFACIITAALHGLAVRPLIRTLAQLGLPHHPDHLGLSTDELAGVLLAAPRTRPGRFTVLEKTELDLSSARSLVRSIWGLR